MVLLHLDDDTLVLTFGFLPISSILALRQTCTRLEGISRLRFIWRQACINEVLLPGYPFPTLQLDTATSSELEWLVIRALRLGTFWVGPEEKSCPRSLDFQASTGTGVSHIKFLPGHGGRYAVTVYKGIWSMITCWDTGDVSHPLPKARKLGDWCPKNTIFAGFVVNSQPNSKAALAVAVQHGSGTQSIEVLSIITQESASCFRSICNIATTFRPVALQGDFIAFSDDASQTIIMNWREDAYALLKGSQRPVDERFQYNRCLQVVFAYNSVLVIRARSMELFANPELSPAGGGDCPTYTPIGFHTFGWIDGVAVTTQKGRHLATEGPASPRDHEPLSILLRSESDDPWAADVHKLEQYILAPNPAFDAAEGPGPVAPYLFPPVPAEHTSPTVRGFLRCRAIALGPSGTALWIQPKAARTAHLTGLDVHSSATQITDSLNPNRQHLQEALLDPGDNHSRARTAESLCAAVFAGPLQRQHPDMQAQTRTLWVQSKEGCNWTAFDYDEEAGRVVLGSSDGSVTVLDLV